MANNARALGLDFLTRIVNVNWGGLAVEFGNKNQDAPTKETPAPTLKKK